MTIKVCDACKGKGAGIFTPKGELTYSGKCPMCDGSGKVEVKTASQIAAILKGSIPLWL